ncbi:PilW family protein [Pantoea sp. 18069]|uniref:PilW family protein n=1 Tax=Pantoea sp. 18069 TaxID=2681415 RepID=UPI00135CA569|nr:PilW family protein [Pantoea sp. 18069]
MQAEHSPARLRHQRGMSMIELLVGLTIGLLTIAVAIGTLVISRQVSGTVNDASQLQLQAAQAFRSIGQQARQAGSVRLNLAIAKEDAQPVDAGDAVAFEVPKGVTTVGGKSAPGQGEYQLVLGYQNYTEDLVGSATPQSQFRDCLGQAPSDSVIRSGFVLDKASGVLRCAGSNDQIQPVIANVADFRVRFIEQQANVTTGMPTMQYRTADSVAADAWPRIHAVEVCLEMEGTENLPDTGAATQYVNCANQSVARGSRLRMVFRNTYQIRSQGRPSPAAS